MDGDVLKLVRIRCRVPTPEGVIVARDVDTAGRVHFALLEPLDGGRVARYAVDAATGKLVGPALDEP
ncbi:MAG: hypothetical protein ACLPJH_08060 [Myxococcaceae bacterium]